MFSTLAPPIVNIRSFPRCFPGSEKAAASRPVFGPPRLGGDKDPRVHPSEDLFLQKANDQLSDPTDSPAEIQVATQRKGGCPGGLAGRLTGPWLLQVFLSVPAGQRTSHCEGNQGRVRGDAEQDIPVLLSLLPGAAHEGAGEPVEGEVLWVPELGGGTSLFVVHLFYVVHWEEIVPSSLSSFI